METGVVFDGPRGGRDNISMGWTQVNTTWGTRGWVGGSTYDTGIPNVKLGKLRVPMIGLLMMPDGGKRKGIVWIWNEPQ